MEAILQKRQTKLHAVNVEKEKQIESNEMRVNEMLSEYFIWVINNNIAEF